MSGCVLRSCDSTVLSYTEIRFVSASKFLKWNWHEIKNGILLTHWLQNDLGKCHQIFSIPSPTVALCESMASKRHCSFNLRRIISSSEPFSRPAHAPQHAGRMSTKESERVWVWHQCGSGLCHSVWGPMTLSWGRLVTSAPCNVKPEVSLVRLDCGRCGDLIIVWRGLTDVVPGSVKARWDVGSGSDCLCENSPLKCVWGRMCAGLTVTIKHLTAEPFALFTII